MKKLTLALFISLTTGCVYYPTVDDNYKNCALITNKLELDHANLNAVPSSCKDEECVAQLVVYAAVPATTFVISGSIVVVGNVIHWMEKEGTCEDGFVRSTLSGFLEMLEEKSKSSSTNSIEDKT